MVGQSRPSVKMRRSSMPSHDIGGFRRDDVFLHRRCHHARHAARKTAGGRVIAEPALGLIGHAVRQDLLIFRRQRSLLRRSPGLGRIELYGLASQTRVDGVPLAFPVGVFRVVGRLRDADRHHQCGDDGKRASRASMQHGYPPCISDVLIGRLHATFTQPSKGYWNGAPDRASPPLAGSNQVHRGPQEHFWLELESLSSPGLTGRSSNRRPRVLDCPVKPGNDCSILQLGAYRWPFRCYTGAVETRSVPGRKS